MRIWFVNQNAYAPDQYSGTRHYALAAELIKSGHEAMVISSSFYHKARKETRLKTGQMYRRQMFGQVPFHWVRAPEYGNSGIRRVWSMLGFARNVIAGYGLEEEPAPDVIIGSSPSPFGAWAGIRLAKKYNVPFVYEIRDVWPDSIVELGGLGAYHPFVILLSWLERYMCRTADAVISLLPRADQHVIANGGKPDRIFWVPNGVQMEDVPYRDPKDSDSILIAYAGVHGRYNGLDKLLEAAEILNNDDEMANVKIRLTGDGPYKAKLKDDAERRGLTNVEFHDPVPKEKIFEHLREADAFVMILRDAPVFRYGISANKLWDYMAVGRPIVFSVSTEINPVRDAGAGVTVEPDNPHSLADGIREIARLGREERKAMGRRARGYAEKNHDMKILANRVIEIVEPLVDQ